MIDPLTGEFNPNLLSEDVKTQILDLAAGIGTVIGGAVGDSSYNAQLAGVIGQNVVENNGFSIIDENYGKVEFKTHSGGNPQLFEVNLNSIKEIK